MYRGVVSKNESLDPKYTVKFSYDSNNCNIPSGVAIYIRQAPSPKIYFDDMTDILLTKLDVDTDTLQHIKLEIGKTICDFILSRIR